MIQPGQDTIFIVAAYAGVGIAILALIVSVLLAARRVNARLEALEARGIRRRSAGPAA